MLPNSFRYCPYCCTELVKQWVYSRVRPVCPNPDCQFVQFIDPKVGAAAFVIYQGKVLLVQRNVDPARGAWCFPGGFMEQGERPHRTAERECLEESGYIVQATTLLDVHYHETYRGSGVLIIYQARLMGGSGHAGDDAAAVDFFGPEELPAKIAFESNQNILARWKAGKIE